MSALSPYTIEVILADVDGTIIDPKGSARNLHQLLRIERFCRLAKADRVPPLCISTGRNRSFAEGLLQDLGIQASGTLPHIIEGGCALFYATNRGECIIPTPGAENIFMLRNELDPLFERIQQETGVYLIGKKCI